MLLTNVNKVFGLPKWFTNNNFIIFNFMVNVLYNQHLLASIRTDYSILIFNGLILIRKITRAKALVILKI